ncbi:hypothetical protein DPMN_157827 [Dreissena polymorpha]|uniref:Uncharacterized protein n=1 Tax=Dreissena polymorpha TaxID=45954 RepID=A0A9D4IQD0_DREPO|nr:hypothetical protein DPMN_157826 [Dreissena polymorpha]KAH3780018.1 hypothetical protein DPMN_157827 [Dreissena polymorpha]
MFILMKSGLGLYLGHLGSETRSLGQINNDRKDTHGPKVSVRGWGGGEVSLLNVASCERFVLWERSKARVNTDGGEYNFCE